MKHLIPRCLIGFALILEMMLLSPTKAFEVYAQARSKEIYSGAPLSFADRKVGVINQLRWLNQSLRELRLQINPELPLKEDELTRLLQESSLGQLGGQSLEVSLTATRALKRRSIDRLIAYPQLLMTLGDALFGIKLERVGVTRLRDALTMLNTTPRHFERAMIALFERGRGILSAPDVVSHWVRYQSLCQRLGRPTSAAAHYIFAKALYFAGDYTRAERALKQVTQRPGYQARAIYIQGVIKLIGEDWGGAYVLFLGLKTQLDRYISRQNRALNQRRLSETMRAKATKKIVSKRPRVRVTQVIPSTPDRAQSGAAERQEDESGLGLSPDLLALLAEVTREETRSMLGVAPPMEEGEMVNILQTLLSVALARISVLKGDLVGAWQFYRQVSSGSPLYQESLLEAAYVMKVRRDYERCADLLSVAIAAYPSSEAALDLRLWQAEMLARAQQTDSVRELYSEMKQELDRQEQVLINSEKSIVLFAPEVLAWLPRETAQRDRMLSQRLRELEIWLAQSRRHLEALKSVIRTQKYPALERGADLLKKTSFQLDQLNARLPQLIERWKAPGTSSSGEPTEGQPQIEVEINRGVRVNQDIASKFGGEEVLASVVQLKRRIKIMSQEIQERQNLYRVRLTDRLKREELRILKAEAELKRLASLIEERSRSARILAIKRVRGFKAQLELGPILQDFWIKEAATDLLDQARMMSLKRQLPLRQLSDQELEAPPTLSTLDILAPAIKQYIISPLPDPERGKR